ncbi:MAG: YciK family oxidoreductase [Gammaproteobacteria bacterium]|nr:YciK family oxidoreductase [Gammaproteobacteria bacterium]NND60280.1 YciK family oxidoreductase [Gammaproteobacteria bacterium]
MSNHIDYTPPENIMRDRIVLVTGATRGIGKAVALALAGHGAQVIGLARDKSALDTLCEEIDALGAPPAFAVQADFEKLDWDAYLQLSLTIHKEFGRLDGLLHNASLLGQRAPIAHYDTMTWHRVMHVNVSAQFLLTRALLPVMQESSDGSIVFTSSGVGRSGRAYWGAYAVSKFATEGLMEVLADELDQGPIRVNAINPGATRTAMRAAAYPGEDPMTLATPESLAPAYLYLLGPDSHGVSGRSFDAQVR